jgi:hypothetical protein
MPSVHVQSKEYESSSSSTCGSIHACKGFESAGSDLSTQTAASSGVAPDRYAGWHALQADIFQTLLEKLDASDIGVVRRTCKSWNVAVSSTLGRVRVHLPPRDERSTRPGDCCHAGLQRILKSSGEFVSISSADSFSLCASINPLLRSFDALTTLTLQLPSREAVAPLLIELPATVAHLTIFSVSELCETQVGLPSCLHAPFPGDTLNCVV